MPILLPLALMATAQLPVAAVDRDLAFPGFNGLPLHASVMAASAHPYFAVLVAAKKNAENTMDQSLTHIPVVQKKTAHLRKVYCSAKPGLSQLRCIRMCHSQKASYRSISVP